MNEEIRIPIARKVKFPTAILEEPFSGHLVDEVKVGIQERCAFLNVDRVTLEESPQDFAVRIGVQLAEYVHTDRKKVETKTKRGWFKVPLRLRDAVLCRMFGEEGQEIPAWWPQFLKEKFTPRTREIMISTQTNTTIEYQRVCPHSTERGHAGFMFGPDLAFSEREMKSDLYEVAEQKESRHFVDTIHQLRGACLRNGYEPSMISLGVNEYRLLEIEASRISPYQNNQSSWRGGGLNEFMGLQVERVRLETYLSIS